MDNLSNIQYLFIVAIGFFTKVIWYLFLANVILSWIPPLRNNKIADIIYALTEPFLEPIRKMIYSSPLGGGMMIDFSPVIVMLIVKFISEALIKFILFIG